MAESATTDHGQRYGEWVAPKIDGSLLIWPDAASLAEMVRQNKKRLDQAHDVRIFGVSLSELRRASRAFLDVADDVLLVATGHQSELHHPGVWIKNVVIDELANMIDGRAVHVALDTDAPKHLKLKWPGFAAALTDDERFGSAAWSSQLAPPTPAHIEMLIDAATRGEAVGLVSPLLSEFLQRCRRFLVDQHDAIAPLDLPAMLANAEHQADWELGLRYSLYTASGLFESTTWATFICHIASDADAFATAYNAALAQYRSEAGITDADRPMPDLLIGDRAIELPFWLDDLDSGIRHRATVGRADGDFVLRLPNGRGEFGFRRDDRLFQTPNALIAWLRARRLRLSSRALSLTMFMRLCMFDLFIHGIGGGHYDQVSDRILDGYFGIAAPGFCVATATLFHPEALKRQRVCLPCLKRIGHRIAHASLGSDKAAWLRRIDATNGFHEKRRIFDAMHEARRRSLEHDAKWHAWLHRLSDAQRRLETETEIFDRELFYLVQPRDRLVTLIDQVRSMFRGE